MLNILFPFISSFYLLPFPWSNYFSIYPYKFYNPQNFHNFYFSSFSKIFVFEAFEAEIYANIKIRKSTRTTRTYTRVNNY